MLSDILNSHPQLLPLFLLIGLSNLLLIVSVSYSFRIKQKEKLWVPFGLPYLRFLAIHTIILQMIFWYWLASHAGIIHAIEVHILSEKLYVVMLVASAYDLVFATLILRVISVHHEITRYREERKR